MDNWIMTYSGTPIAPLDPTPDDIKVVDIAHALAMTCRWAGHCHTYYSVAEHSVRVADLCVALGEKEGLSKAELKDLEMLGLMHDATEAYVGDIPRPIKSEFRLVTPRGVETFREAEAHLYGVIVEALGLPEMTERYQEIVHLADNTVLSTEARDIANPQSLDHEPNAPDPLPGKIHPMTWDKARLLFILRYQALVEG